MFHLSEYLLYLCSIYQSASCICVPFIRVQCNKNCNFTFKYPGAHCFCLINPGPTWWLPFSMVTFSRYAWPAHVVNPCVLGVHHHVVNPCVLGIYHHVVNPCVQGVYHTTCITNRAWHLHPTHIHVWCVFIYMCICVYYVCVCVCVWIHYAGANANHQGGTGHSRLRRKNWYSFLNLYALFIGHKTHLPFTFTVLSILAVHCMHACAVCTNKSLVHHLCSRRGRSLHVCVYF